ncbi:hypothetical protein C1646_770128 [Rhizophagus diaphanus]|nr:hypothetical protein C1646_770128 [Rhizophagus diaphanus] [Rhizophagus sp. MUCL 43196]
MVQQPQSRTALEKLADIAVRLGYTGDITNPVAIHAFIENDLTRKLGGQTQHLRRDHFGAGQETDEETEEKLTEEEGEDDELQNCFIHAVNTATPLLPTSPADVPPDAEQKEDKTLNHAIRAYQQKNLYWPRPLEINFLQLDDPNDVATISCKIKNNVHALNGVAGSTKTLGTINEIPITISEGTNTVTISDEFSVIPTEKDRNGKDKSLLILGTQWQYRAGWKPVVKVDSQLIKKT